VIATLAIAISTAGVLAACGGDDEGGAPELRWFGATQPGGAFEEAAKSCTEDAKGRYRIKFDPLPSQADAQREQLVRRLGAEDSSIDIIAMDVIWTAEFANAGWIREWKGEREKTVTADAFESVVRTATFKDKLYGAPFNSNTQLLWYRKDRVKQAPETWDEMFEEAERIGAKEGKIQVQANRYEGLTVWATAMIASAGGSVLSGEEKVSLEEEPTKLALSTMGRLANSPFADPGIATSTEDTARLGFESGGSSFMINYPFVFGSAKENAPDVFKQMDAAKYPAVEKGRESAPPLGGFNLGVGAYSKHPKEAFAAAECLARSENQLLLTEKSGLPPTRSTLFDEPQVKKAYPGFSEVIKESIADGTPRPAAVAYQDLSLAIQRAIHPVGKIDPDNPDAVLKELREKVEQAVKVEGLL